MNKYQLMNESKVTDEHGNNYPDLATFPLNELRITQKPTIYKLNEKDLYKFFNLTYEYYDKFDFYDDTSAIVFVHLDKAKTKAVIVSVPKNFDKDKLNYDYFITNECNLILKAWY